MENFAMLFQGFGTALTPMNIGACLLGAVLGLVVGAMPGIGSLAGVALLLPLTYKLNPATAIIMLGALYYSNMYGGAFSAILLNIPGDSPAVVTTLDGYPMATKRKRPGQALMTANTASFVGGIIGMVILTFMGPGLANLGLKFGPSEMTALLLIAMTSISWLVGENPVKGLVITALGILLASMGMDTLSGAPRYEFGNMYLLGGIPFTPFVIGAVGFAQVINLINERDSDNEKRAKNADKDTKLSIRGSVLTGHDLKRLLPPALRSGFLGTFVGVLPGAGATTGSFMGYAIQKKFKSEEELGTGAIEGIAASEAANNAAAAGAFAPLLALGIPGSGTGAVLLGGLMMWGLSPGPLLFENEPEFCWGLIASLFMANLFTLIVAVCDSVPDQNSVCAGQIYDTDHHSGLCGGGVQHEQLYVWCYCDVYFRCGGISAEQEQFPLCSNAFVVCTCSDSGRQYAQSIYYFRRKSQYLLYPAHYMCTDAYFCRYCRLLDGKTAFVEEES